MQYKQVEQVNIVRIQGTSLKESANAHPFMTAFYMQHETVTARELSYQK